MKRGKCRHEIGQCAAWFTSGPLLWRFTLSKQAIDEIVRILHAAGFSYRKICTAACRTMHQVYEYSWCDASTGWAPTDTMSFICEAVRLIEEAGPTNAAVLAGLPNHWDDLRREAPDRHGSFRPWTYNVGEMFGDVLEAVA